MFSWRTLLLRPAIGLAVVAFGCHWALSTGPGLRLHAHLTDTFQKLFPLPPGQYARPSEDYGVRLGHNLRKLKEAQVTPIEPAHSGEKNQSKSVGYHLEESPLDQVPQSPRRTPSRRSSVEDDLNNDYEDGDSLRGHRSRSLTLPSSSPIVNKRRHNNTSTFELAESDFSGSWVVNTDTHHLRQASHPIQISGPSKSHLKDSGHYPLTEGALFEYAALSSTPASVSGFMI